MLLMARRPIFRSMVLKGFKLLRAKEKKDMLKRLIGSSNNPPAEATGRELIASGFRQLDEADKAMVIECLIDLI